MKPSVTTHLDVRVEAREKDARPSRERMRIKRGVGNSTIILVLRQDDNRILKAV